MGLPAPVLLPAHRALDVVVEGGPTRARLELCLGQEQSLATVVTMERPELIADIIQGFL